MAIKNIIKHCDIKIIKGESVQPIGSTDLNYQNLNCMENTELTHGLLGKKCATHHSLKIGFIQNTW